jgi:hypothetical protein
MTKMEIDTRREELYDERKKIENELQSLDFEEGKNRFGEKYPIGSIVKHSGREYKVKTYDNFNVIGCRVKKDGTVSELAQKLWRLS